MQFPPQSKHQISITKTTLSLFTVKNIRNTMCTERAVF